MEYLAPGEMFENMLQFMRFNVYFERILYTNNDYFHLEILISATHMLEGSEACFPKKILKNRAIWYVFLHNYVDQILS